jgi:N6-adenosine-specific RNA methylase IME4
MVWVKDLMGTGYWARQRHEVLMIGVKGDMPCPDEHVRPDSVISAARGKHSQKPVELYEVIERCYPGVPRLEMFARDQPRDGWERWGNSIDMMIGGADRGIRLRNEPSLGNEVLVGG